MMQANTIRSLIESGLPGAQVQVFGDDGAHFEAVVIAEQFQGQSLVKRHQLVYACLGDRMREEIHALQLRTLSPDEATARS
ncbi:BolA/IbaG family iron-sulfur metabolism protein [Acidithiobacillus sp. AMEEHan]|uniref:BolA family protein n=1 Tax=Acidithiobacillus sp. AMEEHan TaxID=2994951 RepID=UPI0027E564DF|nr:BolA/IbaG family iron-sulfur metabolism protein [Acidithiobacillus sp. AMEEHan]